MPRIDASIATQIADIIRPVQTDRDATLQAETARTKALANATTEGADPVRDDDVRAAAVHLQQVVEATTMKQVSFGFQQGETPNESIVVIRDQETNKVIRQIPGDDVIKLRKQIDSIIGILFDKHA